LSDPALCLAALEIERGQFEADLGQGLCKKRIALPGQGKSGSTRTLVAKRHPQAIIFLVGREKSAAGSDFPDAVIDAAKTIAAGLQRQSIGRLQELATAGQLKEICDDTQEH
jgi:hypothetical protein